MCQNGTHFCANNFFFSNYFVIIFPHSKLVIFRHPPFFTSKISTTLDPLFF